MLLIIDVFALVALAIRPLENTVSVHLIVSPVACVFSSVRPFVRAVPLDVIIDEFTLIAITVSPRELADALLHALAVVALKFAAVGPSLNTLTILSVMLPEATIQRAVLMEVEAKAMSFVIFPLSLVDVTVFVQQAAVVIRLVFIPVALIETTIRPDLDTTSLPHRLVFEPLTDVAGAIKQSDHGSMLTLAIIL